MSYKHYISRSFFTCRSSKSYFFWLISMNSNNARFLQTKIRKADKFQKSKSIQRRISLFFFFNLTDFFFFYIWIRRSWLLRPNDLFPVYCGILYSCRLVLRRASSLKKIWFSNQWMMFLKHNDFYKQNIQLVFIWKLEIDKMFRTQW